METEKILKELGFTNMTGPLYTHSKYGIMKFDPDETLQEIVNGIYMRGFNECQAMIRGSLGIDK